MEKIYIRLKLIGLMRQDIKQKNTWLLKGLALLSTRIKRRVHEHYWLSLEANSGRLLKEEERKRFFLCFLQYST
jgi:hypothetical protein